MCGLSTTEIEQFMEHGWLRLADAFPRDVAARLRDRILAEAGWHADEHGRWPGERMVLEKSLTGPDAEAMFSDRVRGAFDALLGEGRYAPVRGTGWGLINAPGFHTGPWAMPATGWHIDGVHFVHRLNSPDQGLLCLPLLTDVDETGGTTAVRPGSHHLVAQLLAEAEPHGLEPKQLRPVVQATEHLDPMLCTGNAGDWLIFHPFMVHAGTPNASDRVRVATNQCIAMREPLRVTGHAFDQSPGDATPLERSIVQALRAA